MDRITALNFVRTAGEYLAKTSESFRSIPQETLNRILQEQSLGGCMTGFKIGVNDREGRVYGQIGDSEYLLTGESGNDLIAVSGFIKQVRESWNQWPEQYIEDNARAVISGEYDSIAPAAGSDIFYIRKNGNVVIASTRPKGQDKLETFELIEWYRELRQ